MNLKKLYLFIGLCVSASNIYSMMSDAASADGWPNAITYLGAVPTLFGQPEGFIFRLNEIEFKIVTPLKKITCKEDAEAPIPGWITQREATCIECLSDLSSLSLEQLKLLPVSKSFGGCPAATFCVDQMRLDCYQELPPAHPGYREETKGFERMHQPHSPEALAYWTKYCAERDSRRK